MNGSMINQPGFHQLAAEVEAISRLNAANPNVVPIPLSTRVASLPIKLLRPPSFLPKTGSAHLAEELATLFKELHTVNESHVGDRVLDVVAYYSISGQARHLEERFRDWMERYCCHRTIPANCNRDFSFDPFLFFEDLVVECNRILGPLCIREDSVCAIFLGMPLEYARWLLYTRLWRRLIAPSKAGEAWAYKPAEAGIPGRMVEWLKRTNWHRNCLPEFLRKVLRCVTPPEMGHLNAETDETLRGRLADAAVGIQGMRPVLFQNFAPHKAALVLDKGFTVAWTWGNRQGIANLCVAESPEQVQVYAAGVQTAMPIAVSHEGLLFDYRMPWLNTSGKNEGQVRPLVLNTWLMEQFHERLSRLADE